MNTTIYNQTTASISELCEKAKLRAGNIVVVGCSTSEVLGSGIGSNSSPETAEEIRADAGLDIGFTLIGMHLKKVAVPVRLEHNKIGAATVLAARTRPKFIGGARAVYDEEFL